MWATMINDVWFIASDIEVNDIRYTDTHLRGMTSEEREELAIYPVREEGYDESVYRVTGYTYDLTNGEVIGTPTLFAIPEEELQRGRDSKARAEAFKALDVIDAKSIRALREGDTTRIASLEVEAEAQREIIRNTAYIQANQ